MHNKSNTNYTSHSVRKRRKLKIEIKATTTTIIIKRLRLKYYLTSEGNTCVSDANLEVLPLKSCSKGQHQFVFTKGLKGALSHYQMNPLQLD